MNYVPFQRSYMYLTASLPHINYLFIRRQYIVGVSPTKSTVCIPKKCVLAETTSMTVWLCRYKQISTRHKHSSGRPIIEAALYFGNLRVYEQSGLRKKSSICSTATPQMHVWKYVYSKRWCHFIGHIPCHSSSSLAHINRLSIHEQTILLSALINKPAFERCHRKYSIQPTQAGDTHNAFLALITIHL